MLDKCHLNRSENKTLVEISKDWAVGSAPSVKQLSSTHEAPGAIPALHELPLALQPRNPRTWEIEKDQKFKDLGYVASLRSAWDTREPERGREEGRGRGGGGQEQKGREGRKKAGKLI